MPGPNPVAVRSSAIAPSNEFGGALPFWARLGFARSGGEGRYVIMTGWDREVHLSQAGAGPWRVPDEHTPFGVLIRTPDVAALARADDLVIGPGGILRNREWDLYEVGLSGPDGVLVRIGWPSRLVEDGEIRTAG